MNKHAGFTLIELMIALALGLVVVAAATMLFLTGMRSNAMQQGVSDLQDNANFGLNYITQDVRLANLDANKAALTDQLEGGGIVVSRSNLPSSLGTIPDNALSFSGTGVSNTAVGSDQLVIQFKPAQMGTYDCEGGLINNPDEIVIQRYFLRADTNAGTGEGNPLVLACDAGRYNESTGTAITDYAGKNAGEVIMKRVDHFHVLLNVENLTTGQQRYMTINDYMASAGARILGVSLGVLTRSSQSVGQDKAVSQTNSFRILDQNNLIVKAEGNPQGYIRRVVTQDVALRNALGDRQ